LIYKQFEKVVHAVARASLVQNSPSKLSMPH